MKAAIPFKCRARVTRISEPKRQTRALCRMGQRGVASPTSFWHVPPLFALRREGRGMRRRLRSGAGRHGFPYDAKERMMGLQLELILARGVLALLYGAWTSRSVMAMSPGNA